MWLFEYQDEQGDIFEGDEDLIDTGYTVKHYYLPQNGVSATGSASVYNGALEQLYISENGSKYLEAPSVTIGGDGTGATASAYLINITVSGGSPTKSAVIRGTVKEGTLRSVKIVDAGEGYDEDRATIAISAPAAGGVVPTLIPTFTNGKLTALNITGEGSGYKSVALLDIDNAGTGYTTASVQISAAPVGITGSFKIGESVTGGSTGAMAQLVEWDAQEAWIKLKSPTGTFLIGETIMGSTSGATIILDNRDEMASTDTKYYENVAFEDLGDDIIDFTETNPFGVAT